MGDDVLIGNSTLSGESSFAGVSKTEKEQSSYFSEITLCHELGNDQLIVVVDKLDYGINQTWGFRVCARCHSVLDLGLAGSSDGMW